MSLLSLVAFSLLSQAAASGQPEPQAAPIVTAMLTKYSNAKEVVGVIEMVQTCEKARYTVTTNFQYQRKYKLYIKQVSSDDPAKVWLASSTGHYLSYDRPPELHILPGEQSRLYESQTFDGSIMEIGSVYHAVSKSIGDRSVPLDIAIADIEDLKYIRNQWQTMALKGKTNLSNQEVYVVTGKWRPYLASEVRGTYTMLINNDNELKQYSITEAVAYGRSEAKTVTTTWSVNIKLGATSDPSLYKVYR